MNPAPPVAPAPSAAVPRAALPPWAAEFARLWNSGAHHVFILHGNVHDLQPVQTAAPADYAPLPAYLHRRIFPGRGVLLFFDLGQGLSFASPAMQTRFFEWLRLYDDVERTAYHTSGPPREFTRLLPLLRRFFLHVAEDPGAERGVTLVVEYPEKIVPSSDESAAQQDERLALVTLLKWAASPELGRADASVILVTETLAELHADLVQSPHVARIRLDLPDEPARLAFLQSGWLASLAPGGDLANWSDFTLPDFARRTAGLTLLHIQQLAAVALRNGQRLTAAHLSATKRRLIEEYCQGLVRFKDPRPGRSLDLVATHVAAKSRLRDLARLLREGHGDAIERGVLVPGRVGVGKSFLIDCFASECGLPVLELGEFRSKWVGETERQLARILLTLRALGPVVVVVDEADAVLGNRSSSGDSGVSTRVFAALAAHLGDSSLRGRELWIAMTSRPDLLAIDMKRQGRFGLCLPLFPAQSADEVAELFGAIAGARRLSLGPDHLAAACAALGDRPLTGSDVEAVLLRAEERALLAGRGRALEPADLAEAASSFIDPLDPDLLALQELAAVLACTDRRLLPPQWAPADRADLARRFDLLRSRQSS